MRSPDLINSGLLILRILLGALLAAHGGLKFLQPGGLGFEADLLVKDGLGGGRPAAAVSGLTQVGAGAMLCAGLITPLAAAGGIGAMSVAVLAKGRNGFWVMTDGAEFPLIFAALAIVVGLVGPGAWSLDHALHIFPSTWETLAAVGLGLIAGVATFPVLKQMRRPSPSPDPGLPAAAATASPLNQKEQRR
ncbi:MAG TPA: DoxX family protein [Solirubrobacteraceae bacterium]|nr:DoxX family protein [Solirubrobacteraceae bacterium]